MSDLVSYEKAEGISTIEMNDGKANLMSPQMLTALNAAFDQAETDGAVVILTGTGKIFSAGFDLKVFERGGEDVLTMLSMGAKLTERLLSFPHPILAACNGHAIAMGVFLLLSTDLRIARRDDFRVQANEVAIGLTVPHFALEVCRQRLTAAGFSRATGLARAFTPQEALHAGFIDELVDTEDLLAAAREKATQLLGLDRKAHTETKLRARKECLATLHQAIDLDIAGWKSRNL